MRAPGTTSPRQQQAAGRWSDLFAAMWANEEVDRLPGGRYFKPFADLEIAYPTETADSSWSKVAGVVELQGLVAALDAQPFEGVERPDRERESPLSQDLLVYLGRLLDLFDALARQVKVLPDLLEGLAFGAHPNHLGNLVDQFDVWLACFHLNGDFKLFWR